MKPRNAGFTLIEVLMVVAILAITATMATVSFTINSGRNMFLSERLKMHDLLWRARNLSRNRAECVSITIAGTTATLRSHPPSAGGRCTLPLQPAVYSAPPVEFETGVAISAFSTGNPIVFNLRGGTEFADPTRFTLGYQQYTANFTVFPAIGQVRVE